jgi:gluconolactonase
MHRADEFSIFTAGLDHSADVVRGPDGEIYAGGEAGQIYRIDLESGHFIQLATTGGFLLGVVLDGAGNAYACDLESRKVLRIALETGSVTTYSSGAPGARIQLPNGLAFAADGTLLFSDSGEWGESNGRVYAVSPAGETAIWSTAPRAFTNGVSIDPAGRYVYFAESSLPGISRVAIEPDGSPGAYEVLVEIPGTFPDGVTLTDDGTLLIGCYQPDRIYALAPDGRLEILIDDPTRMLLNSPTSIAFGGPDRDVLVASNLGRQHLVKASLGIRGAELNYPVLRATTLT